MLLRASKGKKNIPSTIPQFLYPPNLTFPFFHIVDTPHHTPFPRFLPMTPNYKLITVIAAYIVGKFNSR